MPSDTEWSFRYFEKSTEGSTVITVIVLESFKVFRKLAPRLWPSGDGNGPESRF